MAVAWLIAELIIKAPKFGLETLSYSGLDYKTRNKAIQKVRESFRVTKEEKERLNSFKIKKNKD